MSRLLLARHGDTELNSAERYWGCTDVKLSTDGLRQAERLRDRLAEEKIDVVYSSDLKRALVTAETIASKHQLDVNPCEELREIDFGNIEGLTYEEVRQLHPEFFNKYWIQRLLGLRFPGGESIDELNSRVSKFAGRLKEHVAEETILIVAHQGPLAILICQLLGVELQFRRQIRLGLASLSIVETYSQGAVVSLLNDASHLRGVDE